ncbi:MAG: glucose-6-phosphate dehydrogenase, partial [Acidimicrobiales bacterium]
GPREQAYARLLDSALDGDQRLFARADGVEEAWRVVAPVLEDHDPVTGYEPGSWGPPKQTHSSPPRAAGTALRSPADELKAG